MWPHDLTLYLVTVLPTQEWEQHSAILALKLFWDTDWMIMLAVFWWDLLECYSYVNLAEGVQNFYFVCLSFQKIAQKLICENFYLKKSMNPNG